MLEAAARRALRARSHTLKPTVLLGQHGLTPAVVAAIEEALGAHELIKIRLRGIEREARETTIAAITTATGADVVNVIGHILTLFRANPEPAPAPVAAPARRPPSRPPAARARPARKPSADSRNTQPRHPPKGPSRNRRSPR